MAIQNRRGDYNNFDPTKQVAGEFAVVMTNDPNTDDGKAVYIAYGAGNVKRLATYQEVSGLVDSAEGYAESAETSAGTATTQASNASDSATLSESWAVGGTDSREGENTDNSKYYAEQAQIYKEFVENAIPFNSVGSDGLEVASGVLDVDLTKVQAILSDATTSISGKMSATDKAKLDGIATGANNYSLPTASSAVKGGAKIASTDGLTMDGETLKAAVKGLIASENDFNAQTESTSQAVDSYLAKKIITDIAGSGIAHNSIYRGKNLGTSVTTSQYAAISAGTFDDLYIGDYWTIGGRNYRIAAFDYYWNCGDNAIPPHHAVIVPDKNLYSAVMNTTDTTTGGYVGSQMYATNLAQAKTTIKAAFVGHVVNHRIYLVNAVANGYSSGGAWADSEVDLMNEQMVYGNGILSPVSTGSAVPTNYRVEKNQLPLFAMNPAMLNTREAYWLRDVITASHFAHVGNNGLATCHSAYYTIGVRPAFCIS
jgi:hypothetical protein